ncbi:MAG: GNAT family N-acetyltransferase [Phycisphaerales bacterium]|nr:GNAT family N-acetyltransferase [Phycisphaerales bacterium]
MSTELKHATVDVRLREPCAADVPMLFEWQSDPESNRLAGVYPRTREAFSALWEKILDEDQVTARVILADGAPAGQISRFRRDDLDFIGYWIARSHWGRGIATQALRKFLVVVWQRPLHAKVAAHNPASMRVLQRCGFVEVGREFGSETERVMACEEVHFLLA